MLLALDRVTLRSLDMKEALVADFSTLPGVRSIRVKRNGNAFHVAVHLSSFARAIRHRAYAKQESLYREFPDYQFDFVLIDESQTGGTENAIAD